MERKKVCGRGSRIAFFHDLNHLNRSILFGKGFLDMNFNFFDWIRDGVKKSVLLGVSDAVEQIGMPHEEEEARTKILGFLQGDETNRLTAASPKKRLTGSSSASSRKLGRSIADIHSEK